MTVDPPKIAIAPGPAPAWLVDAVAGGGGLVAPLESCDALVWTDGLDADGLAEALERAGDVAWVQLPFAGVERFTAHFGRARRWTCAKRVYAEPVAEMALALGLAGLRGLPAYARAEGWSGPTGWTSPGSASLLGANVTIIGGGGIAEALIRMLAPFGCHVTVVRRTVQHMDGVEVVLDIDRLAEALPGADLVVLALALTPDTDGLIGHDELALMEPHAWIVNVARGRHIVTPDLVAALRNRTIGGAALDVTDPEPLPADHPLWGLDNCIVTPHVGVTAQVGDPLLAELVRSNVHRFAVGDELLGLVDETAGY